MFKNFACITSPIAGSRRPALKILSGLAVSVTKFFCGKTGEQLVLEDDETLLLRMSDPELHCHKGLSMFRRRAKYANAFGDLTVPYCTSALRTRNLYRTLSKHVKMSEKYPNIAETSYEELEEIYKNSSDYSTITSLDKDPKKDSIMQIINNYNQLEWDDYTVKFPTSNSLYVAHVKVIDATILGSGGDVVRHVLDHMVL